MKNRFLLITLAILTMGLFVTPSVRAQDDPQGPPPVQPQAPTSAPRRSPIDGGAPERGQWQRFNHAR